MMIAGVRRLRRHLAAAAMAAWVGASPCPAAEAPARLSGTHFVAVPPEQSGLGDPLDLHTKAKPTGLNWPWLSPPVDVNGDGRADVMYYGHHGGGAAVWFGKGDGTFALDAGGYKARWVFGSRDPIWWDFNGDGLTDAIGTEGFYIAPFLWVNDGTGHWRKSASRYVFRDREGKLLRHARGLPGFFLDLDGDGRHDERWTRGEALTMSPKLREWGGAPPEQVDLRVAWSAEDVLGWPEGEARKTSRGQPVPGYRTAFSIDLDGDGPGELIVNFQGAGGFSSDRLYARVLARDPTAEGAAGWKDTTAARGLPAGRGHWLVPCDWDVDGDPDLLDLQAGRWFVNDGKGRFALASGRLYEQGDGKGGRKKRFDPDCEVDLIDLDNDGRPDLVMTADHTPTKGVFLNLGGGRVGEVTGSFPWNRRQRKFGDIDGDGDLDMIASDVPARRLVLYRNDTPHRGLHVKIAPKAPAEAALGCTLWVYAAGGLGRPEALMHYRQVFMLNGPGRSNVLLPVLHVGLGRAERADIRVRFPSGRVAERRGARAGSVAIVRE